MSLQPSSHERAAALQQADRDERQYHSWLRRHSSLRSLLRRLSRMSRGQVAAEAKEL